MFLGNHQIPDPGKFNEFRVKGFGAGDIEGVDADAII